MKRLNIRVEDGSKLAIDFDSIKVDASGGKLYCNRAIDHDVKPNWLESALQHELDVEFSDDNLDVILTIDIELVKSICNIK